MSAGGALAEAALARLGEVAGLNGAYDGPPLSASVPYAIVEVGPESDWSHKSGEGRELRLAILLRDAGERPARLRALTAEVEAALAGLGPDLAGWRLVNLVFLRAAMLREKPAAWSTAIDYRARLLKA